MERKILILGGTGKTGKRVAEILQKKKIPIRIGSRNADPSFDWEKPDNWKNVLKDIEKVYITFQPDLAVPGASAKIKLFGDAAKNSGVRKLVLLSGRGEKEAQVCENIVIDSGMDWTVIRASWFMQNFSENFFLDSILEGHLVLPKITSPEPFVDANDIAAVVVGSLLDDKHSGQIYELTGPELLSFRQATNQISEAIEKPITYQEVEMDDYVKMLREYQTPEDFIGLIKYLFSEVLDGRNGFLTNDVQKVLNRHPTSFADYVAKTKSTGVWGV